MSAKKTENQTLSGILDKIPQTRILVVGDIMLDRFVYGQVERISPESPVPILSIRREERMLGGAGNALANLSGLTVASHILALIGKDEEGRQVRDLATAMNADVDGLITDPARPTIVKTRFLAGHQQLLRTDFETRQPLSDSLAQQILSYVNKVVADVQSIILSDYGKGLLRPDVIAEIIKSANKQGVPVVVDPKGQDFSIYRGAFAVSPNKKELSEATRGRNVESDEEIEAAARQIIQECGIEVVVATRSKDGMSVVRADQAVHIKNTMQVEVYDVSGAGDTVISTIASGLAAGASIEDSSRLANLAGSHVVTKVGTAPIRIKELRELLEAQDFGVYHAPVVDWDALAEQTKRWKARGLKVGFTNGCFDILHSGHVAYLAQARSHCDRLIVALNHDDSVKILKGQDRPVNHESARASVLGALSCVDVMTFFGARQPAEDNTANALLLKVKPDVYFKGGDYTEDQIPETPIVKSYGGAVHVMGVVEGQSTTQTIRKIRNEAA